MKRSASFEDRRSGKIQKKNESFRTRSTSAPVVCVTTTQSSLENHIPLDTFSLPFESLYLNDDTKSGLHFEDYELYNMMRLHEV
jgi:hypothetical protein